MTPRRIILLALAVLALCTLACVEPPTVTGDAEPTEEPDVVIKVPDSEYNTLLAVTNGETKEWGNE